MRCRPVIRSLLFLLLLTLPVQIYAQAKPAAATAESRATAINEKLRLGEYKDAIPLIEGFLKDNPTYQGKNNMIYNLGFSFYVTGDYEKAIARFKELLGDMNKDPNSRAQAAYVLAGATAAFAGTKTSPGDQALLLQESLRLYDDYLKNNPKHTRYTDAFYGKAAVLDQLGKFEEAEQVLAEFFKNSQSSSLVSEAQFLRARIHAAMAKKFRETQKEAEATRAINQARQYFDLAISGSKDLSLANQALLSAGVAFADATMHREAIRYFRRVKSQQYIEDQLNLLIQSIRSARLDAVKSNSQSVQDDLSDRLERANRALKTVKGKTPLYLVAQVQIGRCLYEQKKFDEVLILGRHFMPHFDTEQKKFAHYLITKALIGKKEIDAAIQSYRDFKTAFGKDSVVEDVPYVLASHFLENSRFDDCVTWVDEYLTQYPKGSLEERAYFLKASAYTSKGDVQKAQAANDEFRKKYPNSLLAGAALFNKAYTLYQQKDYASALKEFQEYVAKFPHTDAAESSLFLNIICLFELGKYDEAIQEFQIFEKKHPKGQQMPKAIYQLGRIHEARRDIPSANTAYARVSAEFPTSEAAPVAELRIGVNLFNLGPKSHADAIAAFDQFIKKFPDHADVAAAQFYKAKISRAARKLDEAQKAYEEIIHRFPKAPAAAEAQLEIGEMYLQQAQLMAAKPEKLPPEKQSEWKNTMQKAELAFENVARNFADSTSVDKALSQLTQIWQRRVGAKFSEKSEARSHFEKFSGSFSNNPELQAKIAFTLGSLLNLLNDKEAALKVMEDAFHQAKDVSLPNEGYKQFRNTLLESGQVDKAIAISERQLGEKQASRDDFGVAEATLGLGQAWFEKNDYSKAAGYFKKVMEQYPWHETAAPEAELYLGWIEEKKKNYDEAIKKYTILQKKNRNPALNPRIFLRMGYTWLQGDTPAASLNPNNLKEALGIFLKVGTLFKAFPEQAAEGLYMSGIICETGKVPKDPKAGTFYDKTDAAKWYKKCVEDFGGSPWADRCQKRL